MNVMRKSLALTGDDRRYLPAMVILFLFLSVVDVLGIGMIGPFITLVMEPEIQTIAATTLSSYFQLDITEKTAVIIAGFSLITFFFIRFLLAIGSNSIVIGFAERQRFKLKTHLLKKYLNMSSQTSNERNTGYYIQNIHVLTSNYSDNVLYFILKFIAESIVFIAIVILLSLHNIFVISTLGALLFVAMFSWDKFSKTRLKEIGKDLNFHSAQALSFLRESFDGYEEIRVLGKTDQFIERFRDNSKRLSKLKWKGAVYSSVPKYLLELVVLFFVVLTGTFSFLIVSDFAEFVPILAVFAVAALRLVPSVTMLSHSIVCIRHNTNTVHLLYDDFIKPSAFVCDTKTQVARQPIDTFNKLEFKDVSFSYENSQGIVLKNLNFTIRAGESVGIVGKSGSGKSTLANLMLGLLTATSGLIKINDIPIEACREEWQNHIAVIPQKIFLLDSTIASNVALEFNKKNIEQAKLSDALRKASLSQFVDSLDLGAMADIGENGSFLSGGQRQRLILARAFYHQRDFLIMDEATSALDADTEQSIISEISALKHKLTMVIIAHRPSTIAHCDHIFKIENGDIHYQKN